MATFALGHVDIEDGNSGRALRPNAPSIAREADANSRPQNFFSAFEFETSAKIGAAAVNQDSNLIRLDRRHLKGMS